MAMIKLNCMLNVELLSFVRQFEDNVNTCVYSYQYMGRGGECRGSVVNVRFKNVCANAKKYKKTTTLNNGTLQISQNVKKPTQ